MPKPRGRLTLFPADGNINSITLPQCGGIMFIGAALAIRFCSVCNSSYAARFAPLYTRSPSGTLSYSNQQRALSRYFSIVLKPQPEISLPCSAKATARNPVGCASRVGFIGKLQACSSFCLRSSICFPAVNRCAN